MFRVDLVCLAHPQPPEHPTVTFVYRFLDGGIQLTLRVAYRRSWVSHRSNVTLFTRLARTSLGGEGERGRRRGGETEEERRREGGGERRLPRVISMQYDDSPFSHLNRLIQ